MISHYAAAQSGKALCRGDTFAGGACNGEGAVTLATKADACVRGRVLNENGGLNSLCESGKVVDVLGVHVSRVTVAMLSLDRQIDRFIDILDANDTQDRHHELFLHEGVVEVHLCDCATDLGTNVDADLCENDARVATYAITVYDQRGLTGLGIGLFVQNDLNQLVRLCAGQLRFRQKTL